jgi:hypothetical protein
MKPPTIGCDRQSNTEKLSSAMRPVIDRGMLESLENNHGCRFAAHPCRNFIGEDLFDIVSKLRRLKLIRDQIRRSDLQLSFQQFETMEKAQLSLEHRLLSMPFRKPMWASSNPARDAFRLIVFLLSGSPVNITQPRNPFRSSLVEQLKASLQESNIAGLWRPCSDLLLWTLVIAAHFCHQRVEWAWIISKASFVCRELYIDSLASFKEVLCRFDLVLADHVLSDSAELPQMMWQGMQTADFNED